MQILEVQTYQNVHSQTKISPNNAGIPGANDVVGNYFRSPMCARSIQILRMSVTSTNF